MPHTDTYICKIIDTGRRGSLVVQLASQLAADGESKHPSRHHRKAINVADETSDRSSRLIKEPCGVPPATQLTGG